MDLNGKVAIVTGASRGIGRQIALELARRGVRVVVAARTVEARRRLPGTIGETIDAIEAAGGTAFAVQADIADPADIERVVASAVERYGRLDIVVNNAADTRGENLPIDEHSREGWLRQFDTNVHGPFTMMSKAVPHLKAAGGGVIVNITSAAADLADRDVRAVGDTAFRLGTLLGYGSTKAALNRLTNLLAPDLAPFGIAVACLDPGFTRTELVDVLVEKGLVDAAGAHAMDRPVARLIEIVGADDPLVYSGRIVRTA